MSGPLGTGSGGGSGGGVTSVTAGNGITVTGTTTPTIAASLAAGTGIGISGTTTLSVSNTGVTSIVAGTNISTSGTGAVTVNAPAFGTTITASTIGGTAAAGTSTSVAREDHKHAFPSGAAPASLLVASTSATGTSSSPALADHVHAMPGSAVAGASAVGDTAATGSATTLALSDHRHSREAFGTPVVVNGQTTSLATGSLTTLARADHVHTVSNVPVLLASTTLASDAASYTFSSIPQTYTHLRLISSIRSTTTGLTAQLRLQYNADAGSNYLASAQAGYSTATLTALISGAGQSLTNFWSLVDTVITDYASTTKGKSETSNFQLYQSSGAPGALDAAQWSGFWNNTSALTSLVIALSAGNIKSGTKFQLYGFP